MPQVPMERARAMWNRVTVRQPREEAIRGTEIDSLTDKESDVFEIKRWTKQEDPLSSLLFNTVLQVAVKDDLARWHGHLHG